jgi:glycosyltransferase involved in cell wall biosynthesis
MIGIGVDDDIISRVVSARRVEDVPCGPLISVIMVAQNAQSTIASAVVSILSQTWRHLELVVVDDGSTDSTWSILKRLQAVDGRVRLLRNRVRVGPYVSRNRALQQAVRGSYITCHDADDWAHPSRLASQVRVLLDSGGNVRANVAYMLRIRPNGRIATSRVCAFSPDGAVKVSSVSAMFERRLLLNELGHWDSVRYGADSEMLERAQAVLGAGFVEVPIISMLCRDREAGLGKFGYAVSNVTVSQQALEESQSNRVQYREAYRNWHKDIKASGNAYLPLVHQRRRFKAPPDMVVKTSRIRMLMLSSRKVLWQGQFTTPYRFAFGRSLALMDEGGYVCYEGNVSG